MLCTEKSLLRPSLIDRSIFSGVLGGMSSGLRFILFRSLRKTIQVWHSILHHATLYVAVISSASSMSARKTEICEAKITSCPLILKYKPLGCSNKGRSIIFKHWWYVSHWKLQKASEVLIPESWILGRNPRRIFFSGEFWDQFAKLPSVKNTGCSEDLPKPLKVVALEYIMIDSRQFKGRRVFSALNHQSHSYSSPKILISPPPSWEEYSQPKLVKNFVILR